MGTRNHGCELREGGTKGNLKPRIAGWPKVKDDRSSLLTGRNVQVIQLFGEMEDPKPRMRKASAGQQTSCGLVGLLLASVAI